MKRDTAVIHWRVTCSATAATSTAFSHRSPPICLPATPSTSQSCEEEEVQHSRPASQVIGDTTEASEPQPLSSGLLDLGLACCPQKQGCWKGFLISSIDGPFLPCFSGLSKQTVQLTRGYWCHHTTAHSSKRENYSKTPVLAPLSSMFLHSCALTEAVKDSLALWGLETAADVGIRKAQEWTSAFQHWLDLNDPSVLGLQSGLSAASKTEWESS